MHRSPVEGGGRAFALDGRMDEVTEGGRGAASSESEGGSHTLLFVLEEARRASRAGELDLLLSLTKGP